MISRIFRSNFFKWSLILAALMASPGEGATMQPIEDRVEHGYATNGDVKIHYASLGSGPLIVMIHGFPDFWYTWRHQMDALAGEYQCVAVDQRGYNLSDKPKGVQNYDMKLLTADIEAVIKGLGKEKAIICGHDWGGMVAWTFAMTRPQMTERLIILNLPHPNGMMRELVTNPDQQKNAAYARNFQKEDAAKTMNIGMLTFWVKDPEARKKYLEAFQRSDVEAMLNYYKRNYPKEPYGLPEGQPPLPRIQMPVLMFHGLKDKALLPGGLNDTWLWLDKDLTLVTIPDADHFVQQDAADLVSRSMRMWLNRDK